jgi:hypothetical protein
MIYILDNIFLNGSIDLNRLQDIPSKDFSYEREVSVNSIDQNFIDSINENQFEGDDVVKSITFNFTENMDVKAVVVLNKLLSMDEINKLKSRLAEIFQISSDNIYVE